MFVKITVFLFFLTIFIELQFLSQKGKLLLKKNATGLFNMVCSGSTTRLEVATELLKILGLRDKIKVTEVHSSYWEKNYHAPRPDCESLINKNLDMLGLNIMRDWKICLSEYIEDSYKNYLL